MAFPEVGSHCANPVGIFGQIIRGSAPMGTWNLMKMINRNQAFATRGFEQSSRDDIIIAQKNGYGPPQALLPLPPRKYHPLQ